MLLTFSLMLSVSCRRQLLATIPPNSRNPYYLQHFTFPVIPAAAAATQVHYAFPQMLHPVSAAVIPGSSSPASAPCQREVKCKSVNYIYIYVIINPGIDLIIIAYYFMLVIKYVVKILRRCNATIGRNHPDSPDCPERYGR
jgi:hypothetical protein